ncbi:VOC family protein [Prauserella cavernicola]|uniref:VOC family protein n=1 Tax=Prauserella cavernicola TaxID=2800127 RepID=A0A934QWB3_9PSEU|nr:VOC family protein [Prauserella cavernicola]MBK1787716.1 VOC family protein [Prauserella cavernicola]
MYEAPGTPCWVELATPDLDRSMRFFQDVYGWQFTQAAPGSDYWIALLFGEPVAGFRRHTTSVIDWTVYLATDDVVATAGHAQQLGGTLLQSQTEVVPGVGSKVLVDDPSGATFGLLQPVGARPFTAGVPGALIWLEFVTRSATLADRFFGSLFGYEQTQFGDARTLDYVVYSSGEHSVVGRVRMARDTPADVPPRWIAHFAVDPDIGFDRTLHAARTAGARLRFRPYTNALGKVAVLSDPLGTRFAIIDPALASSWDHHSAADDPYGD